MQSIVLKRKKLPSYLAGLLAVPVLLGGTPLQAAELEEIIVYAQKKEESLQDVPIAISSFSDSFLQESKVETIFDLQNHTPGFSVNSSDNPTRPVLTIRGVGTSSAILSFESSVGVFVDGVFRQRQASAIGDIVDVASVSVLRGPQGSLFGKNTASGALQIRTAQPNTEEIEGFAEVSVGSDDYQNFKGAINIPLIEGVLGARLTGSFSDREGYIDNLTTGQETNEIERHSVRGQLLYTPTDTFSARFIVDYSQLDELCCAFGTLVDGPGDPTLAGLLPLIGVAPIGPAAFLTASEFNSDNTVDDTDGFAQVEELGVSLELNWDVLGGTLTSITAYRTYDAASAASSDSSALDFSSQTEVQALEAFSQELRFASTIGDNFSYTAGLFYYDQRLDSSSSFVAGSAISPIFGALAGGLPTPGQLAFPLSLIGDPQATADAAEADAVLGFDTLLAPGSESITRSLQNAESIAVFGQGEYNVTDDLLLTVGLRYTRDDKESQVLSDEIAPGEGIIGGNLNPTLMLNALGLLSPAAFFEPSSGSPGAFVPQNAATAQFGLIPTFFQHDFPALGEEFTAEEVTGVVRLSYNITPDTLVYASYSTGFKSGATNVARVPVDAAGNPTVPTTVDAETVESFEIGAKLSLFDNAVNINAAVFYAEIDDYQNTGFTPTGFILTNVGGIRTRGVEIEGFAALNDYFTLNVGINYLDARFKDFEGGQCIRTGADAVPVEIPSCDNGGNRLPEAPKWSLNAGLAGDFPVSDALALYGRVDFLFRDEQFLQTFTSNDPNGFVGSNFTTNLRLGARIAETWDVSVWATNLFDRDITPSAGSPANLPRGGLAPLDTITATVTPPRFYGLSVRYTY